MNSSTGKPEINETVQSGSSESTVGQSDNQPGDSSGFISHEKKSKWIRLLFMILFLIVFGIVEFVVYLIAIIGFLLLLLNGKPSDQIKEFGDTLSRYVRSIVLFLSFNTENLPWPFTR